MVAALFEGHGYEEEKREEGEEDLAPSPPDMVAALFEGHGYEEEKREEGEEDEAPGPPEMVDASYKQSTMPTWKQRRNHQTFLKMSTTPKL
jgi:hypothetical protein